MSCELINEFDKQNSKRKIEYNCGIALALAVTVASAFSCGLYYTFSLSNLIKYRMQKRNEKKTSESRVINVTFLQKCDFPFFLRFAREYLRYK